MTIGPTAGWYTDPHDGTGVRYWDGVAWTEHTHGNSPSGYQAPGHVGAYPSQAYGSQLGTTVPLNPPPKKRTRWGLIIGITVSGLFALAILLRIVLVGVAAIEQSKDPIADGDPVTPAGWTATESSSGAVGYSYPSEMSDAAEYMDLTALENQFVSQLPGASSELSGMWVDATDRASAGTTIMVLTTDARVNKSDLSSELNGFEESAIAGGTSLKKGEVEEFNTSVGYRAATLDFEWSDATGHNYATIGMVVDGRNSVMVFTASTVDQALVAELDRRVVDSLVINHAP